MATDSKSKTAKRLGMKCVAWVAEYSLREVSMRELEVSLG